MRFSDGMSRVGNGFVIRVGGVPVSQDRLVVRN